METAHILLVRHPQTEANISQRFVGRGESPYTALGTQQARDLVIGLGEWRPDRVYSSPLHRALDVATPVAGCGVPLIVRDELREVDFGLAEGMTYAEMTALNLSADHLWLEPKLGSVPVGETWEQFVTRVRGVADEIVRQQGRTLVVAHGGIVRALLHLWLGVPRQAVVRFTIANATAVSLTVDDDWVGLRQFGVRPDLIL
ncbi:MAG: histidine phosphatase family protein [Coriobacteriia bacterium]|nr:histidine phosphatase family protein [Coriobacteriia bacterium]MBN2823105.1 histidine phosphatase family protein [Coriobacteriia bacterium]